MWAAEARKSGPKRSKYAPLQLDKTIGDVDGAEAKASGGGGAASAGCFGSRAKACWTAQYQSFSANVSRAKRLWPAAPRRTARQSSSCVVRASSAFAARQAEA